MNDVTVIIPAHNEEKIIGQVIDKLKCSKIKTEIIVVNNCSTDRTEEVAREKKVRVVYCEDKGKGCAMKMGLKNATTDIIVFIDGDLKIYEDDIISLMVTPIIEGKAEFTKAAFEREGGRVTELVAKPLLEILFPNIKKFEQPLGGIIATRRETLENIEFEKNYGVDIGILLDMINNNIVIEEVNIGKIDNDSQTWQSLSQMAKEVASTILKKAKLI